MENKRIRITFFNGRVLEGFNWDDESVIMERLRSHTPRIIDSNINWLYIETLGVEEREEINLAEYFKFVDVEKLI